MFVFSLCYVKVQSLLFRASCAIGDLEQKMDNDGKEEQRSCKTCSIIPPDQAEVLNNKLLEEDW